MESRHSRCLGERGRVDVRAKALLAEVEFLGCVDITVKPETGGGSMVPRSRSGEPRPFGSLQKVPPLNVGIKPRTLNHIKNTDYMENFAQRKHCKNIFFQLSEKKLSEGFE